MQDGLASEARRSRTMSVLSPAEGLVLSGVEGRFPRGYADYHWEIRKPKKEDSNHAAGEIRQNGCFSSLLNNGLILD